MDRDSSVGIATGLRAGRSGDRISVGGEFFRTRTDRPWGPPSLLYNGYRVSFSGVKRPGRGVDHPPHLSPRLKKEQCTNNVFITHDCVLMNVA
jgi:hypothetical protein